MGDERISPRHQLQLRLARLSYLASADLVERGAAVAEEPSLYDRMRPRSLDDVLRLPELRGLREVLHDALTQRPPPSMVLWGPLAIDTTLLAQEVAREAQLPLELMSSQRDDRRQLQEIGARAAERRRLHGEATLLFIDEIQHVTKAQVEALLRAINAGSLILIGVTHESPWATVDAALLARVRVVEFAAPSEPELIALLDRALRDRERGLGALGLSAGMECLANLARGADGDPRRALQLLEWAARSTTQIGGYEVTPHCVQQILTSRRGHDLAGDALSALSRVFSLAMRASDADASLYWLIRLLQAGVDPMAVMRTMIVFASEEIGIADPHALDVAMTTDQALQRLGMPEALHSLGQCCVYLATAPKSKAGYLALERVERDVREHGQLPVPHESPDGAAATYLPEALLGRQYYWPTDCGFEARVRERLKARTRG